MSSNTLLTQIGPSVLIVDDNKPFVNRVIALLSETRNIGHISTANEHNEASRIFETQKPDVVLLDISMPGKSGMELLKQFKKTHNQCHIIMLTNHADDCYRDRCYDLGADYFLDKSNDFIKVPVILSLIQPTLRPSHIKN
jgi:DNA-binding NarL/FixJ family response regulator